MRRWSLLLVLVSCAPPVEPLSVEVVFTSICARCHGVDGSGGPPIANGTRPRAFKDAAFQAQRTDVELRHAITDGKNGNMPAFGKMFTDAQLDGLALLATRSDLEPLD